MKKIFILNTLLCSLLTAAALKDKIYENIKVESIYSVYDGDTFRANLKGYPELIGYRIGIRVNGIDTPEIKGKCKKEKALAQKAKTFAKDLLKNANSIILKNPKRGKYFRIVADVYVDGVSLGQALINENLAVRYDGGTKIKNWCK